MINEVQNLLNEYQAWLRDRTILRQIDGWVEITTPYLDRHNDYMQIYVKRDDGGFLLTDDGYTIGDLERSGCKLDSKKRQDLLRTTINGFGVRLRDDTLEVHASADNFPLRKHNLVQAMLSVNDMFALALPMVTSIFWEDVASWMDLHEMRYTPRVKFTGTSGYDHLFDFVIPKWRTHPERILRVINRPNRDTAEAAAFAWHDTREVRSTESRAYAFLNDSERIPSPSVLDALRAYEVRPILWSERDSVRDELAA